MGKLKYEEESYRIRGPVFEVYREMGWGLPEAVYQECLQKDRPLPESADRKDCVMNSSVWSVYSVVMWCRSPRVIHAWRTATTWLPGPTDRMLPRRPRRVSRIALCSEGST